MAEDRSPSIKKPETYDALRAKGASKGKAAAIANAQAAGPASSRKGGKTPTYEDWSKAELYGRAKELGLAGRSGMDKAKLVAALRRG